MTRFLQSNDIQKKNILNTFQINRVERWETLMLREICHNLPIKRQKSMEQEYT